jgi:NhaP-type Na+/H+ or K+/H+ antiporter
MKIDPVYSLGIIIFLGIVAQWLAWRLHVPSILFLLLAGFLAGPVFGVLQPDALFGSLLFPLVSIAVALIMFEGGLTLRLREYQSIGAVVLSLITIGVLVTGISAAFFARYILGMSWQIAALLGAVLTVTGPTVIGPLLRHVRPSGRLAHILKWEGILIDPMGALLAVIVFDVIYLEELNHAAMMVVSGLAKMIIVGGAIGFLSARLLVFLLKRFWIPDFLKESVTLSLVVASFTLSNAIQHEAGLFTVTIMGLFLDNQREVVVKDIVNFKESLRVLLIGSLFVILSARIDLVSITPHILPAAIFLSALVFVARPLSVFISTARSKLNLKEKLFISWMAPRGIVAAAVASLFALRLSESGIDYAGVDLLATITFFVISGTVVLYGLTAKPLAKMLGLAESAPQGVLIMGGHAWAREIAQELQQNKVKVFLLDNNRSAVSKAKMAGLRACHGDALSERALDEVDLDGIGKLLALTHNDQANALAVLNFSEVFEREELYQLAPEHLSGAKNEEDDSPMHLRGRYLFSREMYYRSLSDKFREGMRMATTLMTEEFTFENFINGYSGKAVPMFLLNESGRLRVFSDDKELQPRAGHKVIALVPAKTSEHFVIK